MAVVQYGSIVTEIKGKIAGHVLQKGNTAFVLRSKGSTKQFNSPNKALATNRLNFVTSLYRELSSAQQASWVAAADSWPFKDKYGNTYFGSGYQFYTAYNRNRVSLGLGIVFTPGVPSSPANPGTITVNTISSSAFSFNLPNSGSIGSWMMVFSSNTVSQGRNLNNIALRNIYVVDSWSSGVNDFITQYTAAFGAPKSGGRIKVRFIFRTQFFPLNSFVQDIVLTVS